MITPAVLAKLRAIASKMRLVLREIADEVAWDATETPSLANAVAVEVRILGRASTGRDVVLRTYRGGVK